MALSRSFRLVLGAVLLALTAPSAQADLVVPVAGASERKADDIARDAIACVAGVLSFHTDEARAACSRVIAAEPAEPLGYKFRGLALLLEHDFDKAEEDFRAALRLDPGDAEIQAGYAQSLNGQGHYAAAISHFDEALKRKKDDVRFLAARCWARMGEGRDLDLAMADCNRAADLAPDFATARLNRGMVRLKQQNYRAAVQDFTRALDIDSDLPVGLFGRGFAYLQLKDQSRAEADIKAARRMNASIDALFIRTGILPAGCREDSASCPLPPSLRVPAAGVWMASYRQLSPGNSSEMNGLDDSIRAMALTRLDQMLEAIALRLNIRPSAFLDGQAWTSATAEAARHLARAQMEYRRLQQFACDTGVVRDAPCHGPNFHYSPIMQDSPEELERELDHTLNIMRVPWIGVCRSPSAGGKTCRIE